MSGGGPPPAQTFLDALVAALKGAGDYNRQDQAPPAAVLWPDKDRQWENLLPRLRDRLPIFCLGSYAPEQGVGPAYWLRCIIARTIPQLNLAPDDVPILYLAGYSRQEVRAVETCPRPLQPLAELQYRGTLWTQRNGRDWTIAAFLQSADGGLGIEVGSDAATREALLLSLLKLADEPVAALRQEAPVRAGFLHGLLHPDDEKAVLRWLNNPEGFRASLNADEWAAFLSLCQTRYGFHPEKDGPISAARMLGQRTGAWNTVWQRFAEAPAAYGALPEALRQARPAEQLNLLREKSEYGETWPQDNDAAEVALRQALTDLTRMDAMAARRAILDLERDHGERRGWVWAGLGKAPLANALAQLATVATETQQPLGGSSVSDVLTGYPERGWRADLAVLDALAAIESAEDLRAVRSALQTMYRPWLEACAVGLQTAVAGGAPYAPLSPPTLEDGTCVVFADGLRFDLAQRLRERLEARGFECRVAGGLAALPSVTGTAKPSISPAADGFAGGANAGFDPVLANTGSKVTADLLRKTLATMNIQVLRGDDLGDPLKRAWVEEGAIDAYGHEHGWRLAHHIDGELRTIERRIVALLDQGWKQVKVVTDHGWLLLPGGLPKAELPEHLTEPRKGRCARMKEGAQTDQQIVPWRWDPSVRIAIAPGIHCYEAGKEYEHGGLSPQECVVPVLTVAPLGPVKGAVRIGAVNWRRLRCDVHIEGEARGLRADVRTKAGDPTTSLARNGRDIPTDGLVSLLLEDADREGEAALLVVIDADGQLRAQMPTIVGGG